MGRFSNVKIERCALDFGKAVVSESRRALTREKGIASKTLYRSISFRFEANKKTISFSMEEYGAYLDRGVTGTGRLHRGGGVITPVAYNVSDKKPPFWFKPENSMIGGDLKSWLRHKGIPLSAEFPIRRSIHAKGIRPRRFFTDTFNALLPEFDKCFGKALTESINDTLETF